MPPDKNNHNTSNIISWPIVAIGAGIGFVLSWSVLSGDYQGRVNLLYLLLVYLVIPISSLIISLVSLIKGDGINLARLLVALPIWSQQKKSTFRKFHQLSVDKHWFFLQSQAAALAFSVASLFSFFLLLVATDVNFVWRSTLLQSSDLLPVLKVIATPWSFWSEAQPTISLLQATQDSRLVQADMNAAAYAGWWPFIFATQLVYSLLPRSILLIATRGWYLKLIKTDFEQQLQSEINRHSPRAPETFEISPVVHQLPNNQIVVNNWGGLDLNMLSILDELNLSSDNVICAGPNASFAEQTVAERWRGEQLVLVKSWEPPLGELADFLQNSKGYLLPLDWEEQRLISPRESHVQEWQRFAKKLKHWQVYVPEKLSTKN
ncbi:DUF2868 domain-containing protein [Aliikangiella coralliicola]|uniref:DUF2868 domain-containing protein n=1 Tax=Aliikangiella coralliicola TaxID=2592383 RepID=A0A545UHU6_9GAMM|nr:DUF2868 domain-containing protein [Aliikangiella coralliicola]TQV89028.1 DUF2868 domain-containing protein [Aliikangiella coralliicola]